MHNTKAYNLGFVGNKAFHRTQGKKKILLQSTSIYDRLLLEKNRCERYKEKVLKLRNAREYDKIHELARACGMTGRDADAFYVAYTMALDGGVGNFLLGCVITCGNQIVGKGCNTEKTNPTQKTYNLRYRNFEEGFYSNREHSIHAEMSALRSISYPVARQMNWSKAKAYVYRIAPGLPLRQGNAAPCEACAHALADAGIKKVYFSTETGFQSALLEPDSGIIRFSNNSLKTHDDFGIISA